MAGGISIPVGLELQTLARGIEQSSKMLGDFRNSAGRAAGAANLFINAIVNIGGASNGAASAVGHLLAGFATGGAMGIALGAVNALVGHFKNVKEAAAKAAEATTKAAERTAEAWAAAAKVVAEAQIAGMPDSRARDLQQNELTYWDKRSQAAKDLSAAQKELAEAEKNQRENKKDDTRFARAASAQREVEARQKVLDTLFEAEKNAAARINTEWDTKDKEKAKTASEKAASEAEAARKAAEAIAKHRADLQRQVLTAEQEFASEEEKLRAASNGKILALEEELGRTKDAATRASIQRLIELEKGAVEERIRLAKLEADEKIRVAQEGAQKEFEERERTLNEKRAGYRAQDFYTAEAGGDRQAGAQIAQLAAEYRERINLEEGHLEEQLRLQAEFMQRKGEILNAAGREHARAYVEPMVEASVQGFGQMLIGTRSFADGVAGLMQTAYGLVMQTISKMIVAHIMGENVKTGATAAGTATRLAMEAGAAVKSVALSFASGIKQIAIHAAKAAAGAYAALASIPYVGPFIAPAAAAAALVGVLALGRGLASAQGGWETPMAGGPFPALLHTEEKVLNTRSSRAYDRVAAALEDGTFAGGGGGDTYIIQAQDARSFERFARDNPDAFVRVARDLSRNGRF